MEAKTISIIIPSYNSAAYIGSCLESVLQQTCRDFEVIVVNDGSSDESPALVEAFAERDARIRVIHQQNQGVSAARNTGLDCAEGAYVAFMDADDTVAPDYLERLLGQISAHDADVVCCDFVELLDGKPVRLNVPKVLQSRMVSESAELFKDLVQAQEAYGTCVWGKLIRAELAKKCRFKPLKIGEDQVYMFDLFLLEPKVYLDDYKGYYYLVNATGAMMQNSALSLSRCLDELQMHQYKLEHLPDCAAALRPRFLERYAMGIHTCAHAALCEKDPAAHKKYRPILKEKIKAVFAEPCGFSGRAKLYLQLYLYAPLLYRLILRLRDGKNR